MEVEIEQRGRLIMLLRQGPGAGHRRHGRADAAAAADKCDDLTQAAGARCRGAAFFERRRKRLPAHRLNDVIGRARGEEITKQRDVVDHAERNDLDVLAPNRARTSRSLRSAWSTTSRCFVISSPRAGPI